MRLNVAPSNILLSGSLDVIWMSKGWDKAPYRNGMELQQQTSHGVYLLGMGWSGTAPEPDRMRPIKSAYESGTSQGSMMWNPTPFRGGRMSVTMPKDVVPLAEIFSHLYFALA
jgi:hypothetical protein